MQQFDIERAVHQTGTFVRDKVDATMLSTSRKVGELSAKSIVKIVSVILVIIIFLFLNVSLGLFIAQWLHLSPAFGLLILSGVYFVILLLWWLVSPITKRFVRNKVALKSMNVIGSIDQKLDEVVPEVVKRTNAQKQLLLANSVVKKKAYNRLVVVEQETIRRADIGQKNLIYNINYVKTNYKEIAIDMAKSKTIAMLYRNKFIAIGLSIVGIHPPKNNKKQIPEKTQQLPAGHNSNKKNPLLSVGLSMGKSLLWSFVLGRMKRSVISFIFGKKIAKKMDKRASSPKKKTFWSALFGLTKKIM